LPTAARILLQATAALIALGGLYDLLAPKLPPNLIAICGENKSARKLVRELLRALGGSLIAIGVSVELLVSGFGPPDPRLTLTLILLLVLPSEGINSICMYRVGSPFYFPLLFATLTILGVLFAWPKAL
jgi:hypothetical protein